MGDGKEEGKSVTAGDLLNLLLVGSDNAAARALARVSPYGAAGFIDGRAGLGQFTDERVAQPDVRALAAR